MEATEINKFWERVLSHFRDFYRYTDSAHRLDHILSVKSNAVRIAYLLNETQHLKNVLVAVAAHDIFSTPADRASHHIKAFNYVLDSAPILRRRFKLSSDDVTEVAYAVLEHRSSHKGGYNSIVSEIVAAADRGIPTIEEVKNYMHRSYLYARDHGKSVTDSKFHAINHVQNKFGRNGKSRVPDWYNALFAKEILERQEYVEMLDLAYFTDEIITGLESRLQQH
ncbi:HD domain-containing protein [Salmonella enterica subsp. enterica serovar Bareilly]|nr:HD domain-containing protein [Salmonella enterica subsp. enterica serovar Bareilly]